MSTTAGDVGLREKMRNLVGVIAARGAARTGATPLRGPRFTAPEELQLELGELGLSGIFFGPSDYADALERRLELRISTHLIHDDQDPALRRRLALSGRIAETHYLAEDRAIVLLLPATLPSSILCLTAFHELSHLAAGDHLRGVPGQRLARREPFEDEELREEEADRRASHVFMAAMLGPSNPYVHALYEVV